MQDVGRKKNDRHKNEGTRDEPVPRKDNEERGDLADLKGDRLTESFFVSLTTGYPLPSLSSLLPNEDLMVI